MQRPARIVTIVKPESYDDAERIAKVLKSGDVAVVSLRSTPEALGKRILDFSFGVACAFEAAGRMRFGPRVRYHARRGLELMPRRLASRPKG